jgi:ferric-chelate reductase
MNTRSGVHLPNFNATDVWAAPNTAINSTGAFTSASHLEATAYIANKWFFIVLMIILGIFILVQVPYTYNRICSVPHWWYGFRLLGPRKSQDFPLTPSKHGIRRLPHYRIPLPARIIPYINLTLGETILVSLLWIAGLGIAGWCQSAFLTEASRSTLVIMALATFTAALGVKSGGVGTWVVQGYTAVNFLHRWAGRLVLLLATLHVIAYLVIFYRAGSEWG